MIARASSVHYPLGLVVGKFSPLHLGHEWLINQAAHRCARLLILSYSNPEYPRCEAAVRRRWLSTRFPEHEIIVLDDVSLRETCQSLNILSRDLPDNASSDEDQQRFLGWLLGDVLKQSPDALFCCESYGPSCAMTLTRMLSHPVTAVSLDPTRTRVPVSATQIRENPHGFREWMAPEVASAFVQRIVLLGGESSGKSTLAAALAAHYNTVWVHEYGRELWEEQAGVMSEADLIKIARVQIQREEDALITANRYLFCDTSPLTTLGYSLWMFGRVDSQLAKLAARTYDAAILCNPDFPFVQDGFRREESFRDQQHAWYLEQIPQFSYPVLEVGGTLTERVEAVVSWLERC